MIKLIKDKVLYKKGAILPYGGDDSLRRNTIAYGIMSAHNTSGNDEKLKIKFDAMASHDITYVGIVQTARASGLEKFPIPYVLTNCHNSLCAVGGTINEDDHVFGLSAAKKYGGIFVPPHIAVIHQYMRECYSECGKMILGSDSHTRYGAFGTMAIGEGGGELVKQLLEKTYDIDRPDVVLIHMTGKVRRGVGPQDVALAIIGAVFDNGFVKNKVMEFRGEGIGGLSMDFRSGIDVMTTETTCLSSIWETDEKTEEYFKIHGRKDAYKKLGEDVDAVYDGAVVVDLSKIEPMIAMPFHPSNVYTIRQFKENCADILELSEKRALEALENKNLSLGLKEKLDSRGFKVDQGVIAGCAGGGYENLCEAADILRGGDIGSDEFSLSLYPASQPIYLELMKNGRAATLIETGATMRTAFCGPCFGAGDVPSNKAFSIRHSTRNFPNREGSKPSSGQIASVALMDARSIAATAKNHGYLTAATELDYELTAPEYNFDGAIYDRRVYRGYSKPEAGAELHFGPNIADWPHMTSLSDGLLLKVASVIRDAVTTTDELIPSGETSSYRSNPLKLAEFTLSRKDPEYVSRAKEIYKGELLRREGKKSAELEVVEKIIKEKIDPAFDLISGEVGSVVYAVKPGDGSAREQAASCQKVLGGLANIAKEYATKRYRSNLINWGMLPFLFDGKDIELGDYVYLPKIRTEIEAKEKTHKAYVVRGEVIMEITLSLGELTDEERQIILDGCLINHYKK